MCTLLEIRQREAVLLMSSHQRCPSLLWSSRFLECSPLKALSIDRLSLMDVRSLSLSLSFCLTAAAVCSKHCGSIITSSQRAMHFGNLPTSSKRKMLRSKPRRDLFCCASPQWAWVRARIVKYRWFLHPCSPCVEVAQQMCCWRRAVLYIWHPGPVHSTDFHTNTWTQWFLISTRNCYWFCFKCGVLGHLFIGYVTIWVGLLMWCEPMC